jgi:ankyrin repeat protein
MGIALGIILLLQAAQPDGATLLHWAAHWDDLGTADKLIRVGADPNATNEYGITPLVLACENGSAAMVGKLLFAGAQHTEPALMTCSWTGNPEAIKLLLDRGADPNAKEARQGQTALMWALDQKHLDAARGLIEHGADVNAHSKNGFTPLLFAAKQGDLDTVRMLLKAGAKVNDGTPLKNRPAGRRATPATDDGDPGVPDGITPLLMATISGHEDVALLLLENGADPNAADGTGATALHYSILDGMAMIGAVSTKLAVNNYVFRPNMTTLIKALLEHGAKPNPRLVREPRLPGTTPRFSLIGSSPFLFAVASGDIELMRLLIQAGADLLLGTTEGTTPLMVAAGLGNFEDPTDEQKRMGLEATKMLVTLGADVNARDSYNWTALHGAAYTGADGIVQFLVEKGAKLDVKDRFGQTPFSIASGQIGKYILDFQKKPFGPHPSTIFLLRKLGADPNVAEVLQDSEGSAVPVK